MRVRPCFHRALLRVAALCVAAAPAAVPAGPKIACDEAAFDFGVSRNADFVEHTYQIRNTGDSDLVINHVRTSCGCTTTRMDQQVIAPGKEAPLSARFSLVGRQGPQKKFIYLECNDPDNIEFRLELSGEVRMDLEVKPPRVYLSQIEGGPSTERTVTVACAMEKPLHIVSLETNNLPGATVRVDTVRDGREYQVVLFVPDLPVDAGGRHEGEVGLRTDHPDYPRISIPVTVVKQEELIVVPREIVLRRDPQPQPAVTRYLLVRPAGDRRLEVLGVDPPSADVRVEATLLRQNQYRIAVMNLQSAESLNGKEVRIRLRRWDDKEQVVAVPIRVESSQPHAAAPGP
jgi:hypothetical protein